MRMQLAWLMAVMCTMCTAGTNGHAQTIDAARAGVVASRVDSVSPTTGAMPPLFAAFPRPRIPGLSLNQQRALAPIASAVIPGAGQAMLGQDRFLGYLTVEIVA